MIAADRAITGEEIISALKAVTAAGGFIGLGR
jgi:hypothetical protein